MNLDTLLNNLLQIIYSNHEKLNIEYSYKDGKESLKVNGEEQLNSFDDSKIKAKIENYKKNIDLLDDCVFVDALEALEEEIDFKQMDELINQEHFSQGEANFVDNLINVVNGEIKEKLNDKIQELSEIREKFI